MMMMMMMIGWAGDMHIVSYYSLTDTKGSTTLKYGATRADSPAYLLFPMWMADVLRLTRYSPVHVPHAVWLITFGSYTAFHLKFESLCGLSGLSVSNGKKRRSRSAQRDEGQLLEELSYLQLFFSHTGIHGKEWCNIALKHGFVLLLCALLF